MVYRRKVRYSDTDAQAIVFNGNYLSYYDDTITDLFDAAGLTEERLHGMGTDVLTAHASIDFKATAGLGEEISFGVRVGRIGTTSITFEIESWVDDRLTSAGKVVFVCVHPTEHQPVPVPDELVDALQGLHAEPIR